MTSKKSLRRSLLAQRQRMSSEAVKAKSTEIVRRLRSSHQLQSARTIFAYRSFRQEATLQTLYETTAEAFQWGFPRCIGKDMVWHQWMGNDTADFAMSAYGIEEPQAAWPILDQPDLILVPAVGCDRQGFRLGYGGGYYDRMLATVPATTHTIGIVFDQFLLDELPIDPWDHPLKAICTESALFTIAE